MYLDFLYNAWFSLNGFVPPLLSFPSSLPSAQSFTPFSTATPQQEAGRDERTEESLHHLIFPSPLYSSISEKGTWSASYKLDCLGAST